MFAAMTICLAFVKVPPSALPLKAVDVDWREMGLVDTIRLRANRIPSDVSWTVRSLPEEEDVAWHEMGFVNGVRVVKPRRAKAKLTRPAQIARPLKPMRKKLELPSEAELPPPVAISWRTATLAANGIKSSSMYSQSRGQQRGIRALHTQLAMVWAAMIGSHHP